MPELRPFKAIRYNTGRDLSRLIAPPYDVIDDAAKGHLKALSPHNIVRLILPDNEEGLDCYQNAARLLKQWLAEGILGENETPAVYLLEQTYRHHEQEISRFEVLGALRLSPFDEGDVLPHEYTLSTPKEDRFRLTQATGMNLSPIFAISPDDLELLLSWFRKAAKSKQPDYAAKGSDGTANSIRIVDDAKMLEELRSAVAGAPVFIADGHHRYETALNYRNSLGIENEADHPANCVLTALGSMRDPGMLILPTHRVIHGTGRAKGLLERLKGEFSFEAADTITLETISTEEDRSQSGVIGYIGSEGIFRLIYRRDALPEEEAESRPASYRRLDVAILHAALEKHLGIDAENMAQKRNISFVRPWQEALDKVRNGAECAFILRPTLMREVHRVASDGCRMPQKSTFFYPKIPSGLVMRWLK